MKKSVSGSGFPVVIWVLFCSMAQAQTPADFEAARRQAEVLQRLEQERLRQDVERAQPPDRAPQGVDTGKLAPKGDASAAGTGCHKIHEIVITGARLLPDSVRSDIARRFVDRCLGVVEIEELLGEITRAYVQRGYVTVRAYLPAQNLSSGRLEITVIEGKVSEIRIEDDGRYSVSKGNAFTGVEGSVLNLRDLEQGVDQVNRLASNNAEMDIQPGEEAGDSVIVIRNKPRRPFHVSVSYDNQGSPATGKQQSGITLSLDNPFRLNDFVTFTHRESTPGDVHRQFSGSDSLLYSIPFGYTTATLGWSHSRYASTLQLPSGVEMASTGNSTTAFLKLERVMYRDQSNRATLGATLSSKDSRNYLDRQFLQVSSRKLTVLDLDGTLATRLGAGSLQAELGLTQGLDAMDAMKDPGGLPNTAPRAQYRKYRIGLSYLLPFRALEREWAFSSQLAGQYAEDALFGSEQLLIGSLYSVRGFLRNTLSGDHGYYWRNEVSTRFPITMGESTVAGRAFFGYDQGEVSSRTPGAPSGRLAGVALGVSFSWAGATWEWFHTRPVAAPSWMRYEAPQTWFRLSFSL